MVLCLHRRENLPDPCEARHPQPRRDGQDVPLGLLPAGSLNPEENKLPAAPLSTAI